MQSSIVACVCERVCDTTALLFGVLCSIVICAFLINTENFLLLLRQDPHVARLVANSLHNAASPLRRPVVDRTLLVLVSIRQFVVSMQAAKSD